MTLSVDLKNPKRISPRFLYKSKPCRKRNECRLEDNVDNDTIVLNKHSVVKKSQLAKGDLIDGLTGQNNRFKLARNQEKI